jgi:hypothetical protein
MSSSGVFPSDMEPMDPSAHLDLLELDDSTADRLLRGDMHPSDAPPPYREVAALVAALRLPASDVELANEASVVTAMSTVLRTRTDTARRPKMHTARRLQLAVVTVVASTVTLGGLTVAGALPGAAQDVASNMLETIGVSVPGPNAEAGNHPDVRGNSENAPAGDPESGKGSTISDLARTTTATGVDKGAVISTAASNGQSQAGQNSAGASNPDTPGAPVETPNGGGSDNASTSAAPIATPNGGGTGTADTVSNGASERGTSVANEHSDGRSSQGSTNAGTHGP